MMKLFHNSTLIGEVKNACPNGFEMHGIIELTDQAKAYDDLFKYWTDENTPDEEDPPFPEKMLNNWFIEDEDGEKKEIGLPGVFDRNNRKEILWRYF